MHYEKPRKPGTWWRVVAFCMSALPHAKCLVFVTLGSRSHKRAGCGGCHVGVFSRTICITACKCDLFHKFLWISCQPTRWTGRELIVGVVSRSWCTEICQAVSWLHLYCNTSRSGTVFLVLGVSCCLRFLCQFWRAVLQRNSKTCYFNRCTLTLLMLQQLIKCKLLSSIYSQLCVVQYGEFGKWSVLGVIITNSPNTVHTFFQGRLGEFRSGY